MRAPALFVLSAFLLAGLSQASYRQQQQRGGGQQDQWNDQDNNGQQQQQQQVKPFQQGHSYTFTYNGQIAHGLDTNGIGQSTDEPQQKAVTRLQAQAQIYFQSESQVTLQLRQVRVGQLNKHIDAPQQVQPMEMFESRQINEDKRRQLELPVQFQYQQGVVGRIQFTSEDDTWSKNIKRSVLNLIQLNLNREGRQGGEEQLEESQEQQETRSSSSSSQQTKSFTLPEITIEGECQTTYTINKNQVQQQQQQGQEQQSQEQDEQQNQQQGSLFNVTKSINFKQCTKVADIAFGFQTEQDKPECMKCQQQWQKQQQQQYQGQQQQQQGPNPCPECDPKEVKEQTLERSTILRFVLAGRPQKYGIQRAELVSQYIYKNLRVDNGEYSSAMQTIVCAELVFRGEQQGEGQQYEQGQQGKRQGQQQEQGQQGKRQGQRHFSNDDDEQKSTLLYDNEWDVEVKNFYMNGEEGSSRSAPFAQVQNKVDQALQILKRLIQATTDKTGGIEFEQLVQLQRLVELFRMCSVQELKQIQSQATEEGKFSRQQTGDNNLQQGGDKQKIQQILADCLAMAGTHNTIHFLAQQITQGQLKPVQAIQSLKSLNGLVAPSDKQAKIILNLCNNEVAHRSPALKQSCWLTFGSIVGELCQYRTQGQQQQQQSRKQMTYGRQTGFKSMEEMCSQEKKQIYKEALVKQYEEAENIYEKVLALKALGNAGITISRLEQIIQKQGEDRVVRIQAIDALRRQRTRMPRKIQRVLLPIFQNTKEHQEVRMAAFAMIMRTQPEEHIVDQLSYTLIKERHPQVQAFVYTTMKALAKSPVLAEQQIAKHLKSTLKLANVDESVLRCSRKYRIPIYSHEQKEGMFLNLVSVFNSHSMLPSHLSASLDTLLNDQYQTNSLKLGFTQRGMEQWYETLVKNLMQMVNQQQQQEQGYGKKTRGDRTSSSSSNKQQLKDMFKGLNIKKRQSNYYRMDQEEFEPSQSHQPFAMICLRVGDVDQVVLPISRDTAPQCLKQLFQGQTPRMSEFFGQLNEQQHFRILSALKINEKSAKIPTSLGVPLQILQTMPLLASIEGSLKMNVERQSAIKLQLNVHPSICGAHIQKMECWTPIIATGVESIRSIELNAPIQTELEASRQQGVEVVLKVPQMPKTRVLGVHTLPVTYTREWDSRTKQLREPKVKSIHSPQLEQLQEEVNKKIGDLQVRGHFHRPGQMTDYKQLIQLLMATENHVHVDFKPTEQTPKKVIIRINGHTFQKGQDNQGPQLDNFYSNTHRFERSYPEDDFQDMNLDSQDTNKQKLNSFLGKFQSQMYEHQVKVSAQCQGGRRDCKAEVRLNGACDQKFKFCRMAVDMKRSAMLAHENQEWTLQSKIQVLTPDAVSSVQQLGQSSGNQKFILQTENQWGSDKKQSINLRIQGEQGQSGQHRQQIDQYRGAQNKYQQKRAAFLNKFDVVADYKLSSEGQNVFSRLYEVVKAYNYWSTQSLLQVSGKDGQCHATVVIDPISQTTANVSVKTPSETIRMLAVPLPVPVRPFSLIRAGDKSTHSVSQLFKRMAEGQNRAECTVDGRKVNTFDDVLYKAPIGKCYSVLAKDCSSEEPRFVVLMKTVNGKQDKKIKIVTPEQTITCQPQQQQGQKRLQCKVNDQEVQGDQQDNQQDDYNNQNQVVEFNNDEQTDVTIKVEGVQVRFGCWCNKCKCQKAWIKISQQYKENQCGLCGHYDDQADNDLRMNDNEQTDDLSRFHRSYTLQDNEDECSADEQEKFYGQKDRFQKIGSSYEQQQQQQYRSKKALLDFDEDEEDNEWLAGAYHSDDTNDRDSQWGRNQKQMSNKRWQQNQHWNKRNTQRQTGQNEQNDQNDQDDQEQEPIEQTKVLEYNHRICFSVQPVKQCPEGTSPSQENGQDYDQQSNNKKKVQFACLDRSDSQARQLQRQARRGVVVDLPDQTPAFVEAISQPSRCLAY